MSCLNFPLLLIGTFFALLLLTGVVADASMPKFDEPARPPMGKKGFKLNYWMEYKSCQSDTTLIILSMSRRDGFKKREGIRKTWMKDVELGSMSIGRTEIRFLIADQMANEADEVQRKLAYEQSQYGDLLFLHGFVDAYAHLHLKMYGGFEWQQSFCANAKWVMKADDDTVIHLPRLDHWIVKKFQKIADEHQQLAFFGNLIANQTPRRRSAHERGYVSEKDYPDDLYPDFMQGFAYLTTSVTIRAIMAKTPEIAGFYRDDVVYTGILAKMAGVKLSEQEQHFIGQEWGYDEKNADCEGTVPKIFAVALQPANDVAFKFEHEYRRLKSMVCSR